MGQFIAAPNLLLPWSSTEDDNKRYWKIFGVLLIPSLIIAIAIPLINVPEIKREELETLPPQLAKIVLEKKELPTPVPTPMPTAKPTATPEIQKEEKKKPPKKEEPKKEIATPRPTPQPAKIVEKAREQAKAEIDQFKDQLSDLRDAFDLSEVETTEVTQGTGKAAELSRDVISSGAKTGSGGINTSKLSRDTGGVAVSGKKTTAAVENKLKTGDALPKAVQTASDRATRSREEIRKIMDQNKGAIYAIYNRALRANPALEGKVVFKLEIDGSGKVVSAQIVSSELNDPDLESRLIARIRLINFGSKDVLKTTLNYDMDFLPY